VLERVEIVGGPASDTEVRRQSTASKIVIGRDELDRMGDTSVADVLKRLPGVTIGGRPGRGGDIRMRGLGSGYTQILVNGERIPPGFSIDTLTPEQIERIEVSRAPTAETGARAIAGTINIVLREDVKRRLNNVHLGGGREAGQNQTSASWTRGDQLGDLSYNLSLSAYRNHRVDHATVDTTDTDSASGATTLAQTERRDSLERRNGVHLGGRLLYKLGGGDTLSLMPFVMTTRATSHATGELGDQPGSAPAAAWATSATDGASSFSLARLNLQWQGRAAGTRYELKGGLNRSASQTQSLRQEVGGADPHRLDNSGDVSDSGWSAAGKLSRTLGADHSVALGWESEGQRRTETRLTLIDGVAQLADFGDELGARTLRSAAWAQDEWNFSSTWSAYAGLRWESITTTSILGAAAATAGDGTQRNRSAVWTPLLHSVWKLDEASKDQIRFALTRSYRNPTLQNLIARPSLSSHNSPTQPDRVGNPDLLPELATGIDLAFEHYLSAGGLASVSIFQRRITHLIRTLTTQETVDGLPDQWVARPRNVGDARSSGIEFEAKFRLAELWNTSASPAPNVDLRSNFSLFRSHVSGVAGPDNRLDQQPRASANLGADWKLASSPLTVGANYNWTPAGHVTLSSEADKGGTSQSAVSSAKRVVDAYALWTFSPAVQLRLSGANLLAQDSLSSNSVATSTSTTLARTSADTWQVWSLRLELKL
jgi:iron complex outermembrane receptor protein